MNGLKNKNYLNLVLKHFATKTLRSLYHVELFKSMSWVYSFFNFLPLKI